MATTYAIVLRALNEAKRKQDEQEEEREGIPMQDWTDLWANYLKENHEEFFHYTQDELYNSIKAAYTLFWDGIHPMRQYAEYLISSLGIKQ